MECGEGQGKILFLLFSWCGMREVSDGEEADRVNKEHMKVIWQHAVPQLCAVYHDSAFFELNFRKIQ